MKKSKNKSHSLEVLGLPEEANWQQIQSRYRQLALSLHPDLNQREDAAEHFQQVNEAYEKLASLCRLQRAQSAEGLREMYDDPRVRQLPLKELAVRLRYSSSRDVRAAVACLLGSVGGRECRQLLLEALRDRDGTVRRIALESLGKIGQAVDLLYCLPRIDRAVVGVYLSSLWRICARLPRRLADWVKSRTPAAGRGGGRRSR